MAASQFLATALVLACALGLAAPRAHAAEDVHARALNIEPALYGFPQRTQAELTALFPQLGTASASDRRFVYALLGQADVLVGKGAEAAELADRLDTEATLSHDRAGMATARLIHGTQELITGNAAKSLVLAREARELARASGDGYIEYWSALALGTAARTRSQPEEALASLQDALSLAERSNNPYRRSAALYQLSVLQLSLKNGPEALAASLAAYKAAETAKSVYGMTNALMAESADMELLQRPARELAAMEEALDIAHRAHSDAAEAKGLANLADIRLRRHQFTEALDLAHRALLLAQTLGDTGLVATSKANMGFALFGLGRVAEGKRVTDDALADYERAGATADITDIIGEYGRNLEQLGDYKGAIGLYHRARALNEEVSLQTRQRALMEMQEKYESEKRSREISLLSRENDLKTAEIATRALQQRVWWSLAAVFALSLVVVIVLYRKLRVINGLLENRNSELRMQSSHDALTGLYNRRYFQEFIAAESARPAQRRRDDGSAVRALLLMDIDHFKDINDNYGHALGDAVLVAVAERLRETLRDTDMIVRWGGEEFLVSATGGAEQLDEIAARILHAIASEPIRLHDKVIHVTASVGYIPMPLPPSDVALSWERAIGLIDMALYMAKVHGRNRAYGICRLAANDPDVALAAAEQDLEHAWQAGLVEMRVQHGVTPSDAAPIPVAGV